MRVMCGSGVVYIYISIYISKIVTFINMVINEVENGSPDMILVAFDRKFDEKKMRYLPGFIDFIYLKFINIGELTADTKTHKWS